MEDGEQNIDIVSNDDALTKNDETDDYVRVGQTCFLFFLNTEFHWAALAQLLFLT
jgi:hypothetical protein